MLGCATLPGYQFCFPQESLKLFHACTVGAKKLIFLKMLPPWVYPKGILPTCHPKSIFFGCPEPLYKSGWLSAYWFVDIRKKKTLFTYLYTYLHTDQPIELPTWLSTYLTTYTVAAKKVKCWQDIPPMNTSSIQNYF